MPKIQNYIGGELVDSLSGEFMDNVNPAKGEVYSQIPNSVSEDALSAIESAKEAFPAWKETPVKERVAILRKVATRIREKADKLAEAESVDTGKPIKLSTRVDIPRAAENFEFFADAITQFHSDCYNMDDKALNYTLREPHGVVTCISPWNLPLYLLTWKIAPALAAGNTVVAKPSEVTPMTAFLLSEICIEVGLPAGVLNILHGTGANLGETLTTHEDIKAVSFTGSTATGKIISQNAAPLFKKVSLEMGGKNPNIIFADCDFEKALDTTVRSSFANQGQICLCGSRIFVERPIYEKFKTALIEKAQNLVQGDPLDEKTDQGAVVSKSHYEKILGCLEMAKKEGASVLCGGKPAKMSGEFEKGHFIEPTLLEGLSHDSQTNQEEIFGPVATLIPFETEKDVTEWANSTRYGLAGSLWTRDLDRAHRMARNIQSGIIWVNTWLLRDLRTPFGGMKDSGVGREGGEDALRFFTEPKNVCLKFSN